MRPNPGTGGVDYCHRLGVAWDATNAGGNAMSNGSDAVDEIRSRAEAEGVEFIYAMFVEMHGKPCAKLVPVSALEGLMSDGAGFAGFAAGPMGQDPSSPDILALPDPASYTHCHGSRTWRRCSATLRSRANCGRMRPG